MQIWMLFLAPSLPRDSFTACDGKTLTKVRASTSDADDLGEEMGEMGTGWKRIGAQKEPGGVHSEWNACPDWVTFQMNLLHLGNLLYPE